MPIEYPFNINPEIQRGLEYCVEGICASFDPCKAQRTEAYKSETQILTLSDIDAFKRLDEFARSIGAYHFSEEEQTGNPDSLMVQVTDPIDGTTSHIILGPNRSSVSTAAMIIQEGEIIAACVGDINNNYVFGVDDEGLYVREANSEDLSRLQISNNKLNSEKSKIVGAAYAPYISKRMEILYPDAFDVIDHLVNDGGHLMALRVVEGEDPNSISAAMELKPVGLWEHIGPLMAYLGGAFVSRLDGEPLELDPAAKQTSITAASTELGRILSYTLEPKYESLKIPHYIKE